MMNLKLFLSYTAIIEALTGILLIVLPSRFVALIFHVNITEGGGIILTMIAGAAIFSLSLVVWLSRMVNTPNPIVTMLLTYNLLLTVVVAFGALSFFFRGGVLWLIIIFHFFQTLMSAFFLKKTHR